MNIREDSKSFDIQRDNKESVLENVIRGLTKEHSPLAHKS